MTSQPRFGSFPKSMSPKPFDVSYDLTIHLLGCGVCLASTDRPMTLCPLCDPRNRCVHWYFRHCIILLF